MSDTFKPKTRFCPSPTGLVHLGNIRTALFSALLAKALQGDFLLRIEDTDRERSDERYTMAMMTDMLWLGLDWQEGPKLGDAPGQYHQSERQAIYDDYYSKLETSGIAFPCFCSEEQLTLTRKIQLSQGKPPRYAGTCRKLTREQVQEKIAAGEKPVLRFHVRDDAFVEFEDLVRGKQRFSTNDIGDFIIRRTDGTSPFMFCNAIDDSLMGVTHVLRGEDHLTNTPRQLLILEALQLRAPQYGHIALIVGPDGSPLSKRHGSKSVQELREQGYLALAIDNYLARLGHYYGNDDFLSLDELAAQFKLESLSKSPAKFNPDQLRFWQKTAVNRLSNEACWEWFGADVHVLVPAASRDAFIELVKPNLLFPEEALLWAKVLFTTDLLLGDEERSVINEATARYFSCALEAVEQHGINLNEIIAHLKKQLDVKGKGLYQPLRVAITGQLHGPELVPIFSLMDKQLIVDRLKQFSV